MNQKRTSVFENSIIWFGAGVSMAEIMAGTYFAPLGFMKGMAANLLGHGIGCILLFLAGMIGAKTRKSSMETVKMSFGQLGSILFAILNVLQLAGWTAIMIYDAAIASNGIIPTGIWLWCLVVGLLIILWLLIGIKNLGKLNTVAMVGLFLLSMLLCYFIFAGHSPSGTVDGSLSFGVAVELAAAMPLSWLPLISDYTREAEKPFSATLASAGVYGLVSCWMYAIGMGAAIFTGELDIAQIMLKAGVGIAGLIIIILSTVTTTFMDAFSAGVSSKSISSRLNGRTVAIIITIISMIAAMVYPMDNITNFLYLIGSVFAPMIAIQITDYFILKRNYSLSKINLVNLVLWFLGFIIYRNLMKMDIILGNTLPDMLITMVLCVLVNKGMVLLKIRKD